MDANQLTTKKLKRVLGRKELIAIGIGQIIGAGIFSLTGLAIGFTGRTICFSFIVGALFSIAIAVPGIFVGSSVRLRGGQYTMAHLLLGEKISGVFIVIYVIANISIALYALSFADYFISLVTVIPPRVVAVGVLTLFFILNILGMKNSSRVQNLLVIVLLLALSSFVIFGLDDIAPGYFNPQRDVFFQGWHGFAMGCIFTSYATSGAITIVNVSGECKNPTKDVPFATGVSTLIVALLFALVGFVAAGVLPYETVAYEELALVAKVALPKPIFIFFVTGGALLALATTINANFMATSKPILQACVDGWFPSRLGAIGRRFSTPHFVLLLLYFIGIVPIIVGFDIEKIANYALILMNVTSLMLILGTLRLPRLVPRGWEKSPFHVSNMTLRLICLFCAALIIFQNIMMISYDLQYLIPNLVVLLLSVVYAFIRYKTGRVHMEKSYEEIEE